MMPTLPLTRLASLGTLSPLRGAREIRGTRTDHADDSSFVEAALTARCAHAAGRAVVADSRDGASWPVAAGVCMTSSMREPVIPVMSRVPRWKVR